MLYSNPYGVASTTVTVKPLTVTCAPSVFSPVKLLTNNGSPVALRALDGGSGLSSQNGYEARFANLLTNTEYTIIVMLSPSINRTFTLVTPAVCCAETVVEFIAPIEVCPDGEFMDTSNNQCQQCPPGLDSDFRTRQEGSAGCHDGYTTCEDQRPKKNANLNIFRS